MSDSLRPHEPQHARFPCPSPTPRVHPNLHPSSQWCHPAISCSVIPFSSCPQSFPASGSFPVSQIYASGGQSIGLSASTSVLPMNTQDWSPLGWIGWVSLQSKAHTRNQFMFVSECSFLCHCRHRLYNPGLELRLGQPDWEPHFSGVTGNSLSASALLPAHLCRLRRPGPGAAAHRWEGVIGWEEWGAEQKLRRERLGVAKWWRMRTGK